MVKIETDNSIWNTNAVSTSGGPPHYPTYQRSEGKLAAAYFTIWFLKVYSSGEKKHIFVPVSLPPILPPKPTMWFGQSRVTAGFCFLLQPEDSVANSAIQGQPSCTRITCFSAEETWLCICCGSYTGERHGIYFSWTSLVLTGAEWKRDEGEKQVYALLHTVFRRGHKWHCSIFRIFQSQLWIMKWQIFKSDTRPFSPRYSSKNIANYIILHWA